MLNHKLYKNKGGRPTKYNPDFDKQAEKLCRRGCIDTELAYFFDVNERTINRWKIKYPTFCQSIKKGKLIADAKVAESLYKCACGYSYKVEKLTIYEGRITNKTECTKHCPPDTTAIIFWLKNRQPKKWCDKPLVKHT